MELISYDFEVKFLLIPIYEVIFFLQPQYFLTFDRYSRVVNLGTYPYVLCILTSQQLVCIYCSSSSSTNYASYESQYSCLCQLAMGGGGIVCYFYSSSSTYAQQLVVVLASGISCMLRLVVHLTLILFYPYYERVLYQLEYQLVPMYSSQSFSVLWIVHTSQYILVIPY